MKRRIEGEFAKPDPQLVWAEPVLFEPGGRAWFRFRPGSWDDVPERLLGYDGAAWVERESPPGIGFDGGCPGHDRWPLRGENVYCQGRAFFTCGGTVHCYDGRGWATKEFYATPTRQWHASVRLLAEPDGKGVVAVAEGVGEPRWTLARWRDGKWAELARPAGSAYADVRAAAAAPDGVWLLFREQGLAFVAYGDEVRTPDELIARLGDKDFHVRDAAERQLEAGAAEPVRPGEAQDKLRAALAVAEDSEVRARLQKVLQSLEQARREAESGRQPRHPAPPPLHFGGYDMPDPRPGFLLADRRGNLFIKGSFERANRRPAIADDGGAGAGAGAGAADKETGRNGILMVGADGSVRLLDDPALVRRWGGAGEARGPLFFGNGKAWLPGETSAERAGLLDVAAGRVVAEVPDRNFHDFKTVQSDGTLFVEPGASDSGPIMAFNPHPGTVLLALCGRRGEATRLGRAAGVCVCGRRGVLGGGPGGRHPPRFTGRAWEPVAELAGCRAAWGPPRPGRRLPVWCVGQGETPTNRPRRRRGRTGSGSSPRRPKDAADRGDSDDVLEDLLLRHRDTIASAFAGRAWRTSRSGVRADGAGTSGSSPDGGRRPGAGAGEGAGADRADLGEDVITPPGTRAWGR